MTGLNVQAGPRAEDHQALLKVRNLEVSIGPWSILRGIDLDVARGEAVALVGESGSGKSMLARSVMGLLPSGSARAGSIRVKGRELTDCRESEMQRVRGREVALVFQDPFTMLNPTMKCGDQIVELVRDERGRKLRGDRRRAEIASRLAEVGVRDVAVGSSYPGELSGGLRQRVGIAAALALDPDLLIADEPTTALDVTTQRGILRLLRSLQRDRGMGLILITHDLGLAFSVCDRAAVMYAGAVVETGQCAELEAEPHHPYTSALMASTPPADRRLVRIPGVGGAVAQADTAREECSFAPRCAWAIEACWAQSPPLLELPDSRRVACVRHGDPTLDVRAPSGSGGRQTAPALAESQTSDERPLLEVRDLRKSFGSSRRVVKALAGVDLSVAAGECVGIVGESGSGKSTLARCVLGLEHPDSGSIRLGGTAVEDFRRLSRAEVSDIRHMVQMVFQDPNSTLNPAKTVGATILEAARARRSDAPMTEVNSLLDQVGLSQSLAHRRPRALSGGQRQRVAIARALAVQPSLLVCDEAVSALDVSVQAQVLNLLNDLRENLGISILFITHDLAVVRQVADRVYVMLGGSVVEHGATADVLDAPVHSYTQELMAAAPSRGADWFIPTSLPDRSVRDDVERTG